MNNYSHHQEFSSSCVVMDDAEATLSLYSELSKTRHNLSSAFCPEPIYRPMYVTPILIKSLRKKVFRKNERMSNKDNDFSSPRSPVVGQHQQQSSSMNNRGKAGFHGPRFIQPSSSSSSSSSRTAYRSTNISSKSGNNMMMMLNAIKPLSWLKWRREIDCRSSSIRSMRETITIMSDYQNRMMKKK
jgi:hypothetical protein